MEPSWLVEEAEWTRQNNIAKQLLQHWHLLALARINVEAVLENNFLDLICETVWSGINEIVILEEK